MTISIVDFIYSWGLNFIEFFIIYFIVSNIADVKFRLALKNLSVKIIALGIVHVSVITTFWVLFGRSHFQTAISFSMMLLVVAVIIKHHKKVKTTFDDIIIVYLITYLIASVLIAILILIINTLDYNINITNLLTFVLGLIITCFACTKIDLSKLFILFTRHILVKFTLFGLAFIFVIIFAVLQYDTTYLAEYLALFLVLVVVSLTGLIQVVKIAYQYTEIMPEQIHDIKKLLTALQIQSKKTTSLEDLKASISNVVDLVGINILNDNQAVIDDNFETFILTAIEHTKLDKKSNATIIVNINYHENRKGISDIDIAYMLGVLLENAIETLTKKPIFISLFVSEYLLLIKVKNESKLKDTDLGKMMKKGYSSKGNVGRGVGLAKLKRVVENKGGKLLPPSQIIHDEENVNYLTMTIRI
jgi:hypothetical protein